MERDANEVYDLFTGLQDRYSERNVRIAYYEQMFDGDHWDTAAQDEDSTSFQLVFNYCRTVSLKYAAMLARSPRIRIDVAGEDPDANLKAGRKEKMLHAMWDEIMEAWRDVEMNAAKKTFGVLQVLWAPEKGQPRKVMVGQNLDEQEERRYTTNPFKFRSIMPEHFYPVYRTYDKPDDYMYVVRFDPGRLVLDIEQTYGVSLQPTSFGTMGTADEVGVVSQEKGPSWNDGACDLIEYWDDTDYKLIAVTRETIINRRGDAMEVPHCIELKAFKHSYGRAPFYVLQNIRIPDRNPVDDGSIGDVDAIISVNKHFNLVMSEQAEEILLNIHRPMVYASADHEQEPAALELKPGSVYPIGENETLEPVPWQGIPQVVENHLMALTSAIQDLSFIGEAGFGQYPAGASGVGLRLVLQSLEQIMTLKIPLRVTTLKAVICQVFTVAFNRLKPPSNPDSATDVSTRGRALQLWVKDKTGRFGSVTIKHDDIGLDHFADIDYGNLLPRNEVEYQQNEVFKLKSRAQSLRTTLGNIGIEDVDGELETIKGELADPILNPEHVVLIEQAKQLKMQNAQQEAAAAQPVPPGGPGAKPGGLNGQMGGKNTAPPSAPPMAGSQEQGQPTPGGAAVPYGARTQAPNMQQLQATRPGPGQNPGNNRQ